MTYKQLQNRLDMLINAHAWSRQNDKVKISIGQRICISQERAALMQVLDLIPPTRQYSDYQVDTSKIAYMVPEHLNIKVLQIATIIKSTGWTIPKHEIEPY